MEGEIRSLNHLGEVGAAAASLTAGGRGAVVILDGVTGEIRASVETPTAARSLVTPDSGAILGVGTGSETHFYEVEVMD